MPREHLPSNVPDESVLRRRVPELRSTRAAVLRRSAGGTRRPYGLRVSSRHQVHLSQIRCFGNDTEARLPLHTAAKHRQRKDLHLHLVLVYDPLHHADRSDGLQSCHHFRPGGQTEIVAPVFETVAHRDLPEYQQENRAGRLVASLRPIIQHGLADLQGLPAGAHEKNERHALRYSVDIFFFFSFYRRN